MTLVDGAAARHPFDRILQLLDCSGSRQEDIRNVEPSKKVSLTTTGSDDTLIGAKAKRRECQQNRVPDVVVEIMFRSLKQHEDMKTYRAALCVSKQFERIGSLLLRPPYIPLPDEILLEVFAAVRFNSTSEDPVSDLASCLRVSKQWYRAGMPLMYKHFVMDVNYRIALSPDQRSYSSSYFPAARDRYDFIPSARFYDTATKLWSQPWKDSGLGSWIYSLSVEIHFNEQRIDQKFKESITDVLERLPNVRTFSIRAAPLRQNNQVMRGKFVHMLQNLPLKIFNFELDLRSRDTTNEYPHQMNDVCAAIAKVVPQLRTLRLRLSTICYAFLLPLIAPKDDQVDTQYPKLRALSISAYRKDFEPQHQCCSSTDGKDIDRTRSPTTRVLEAIEGHVSQRTLFPSLKECALVYMRVDESDPHATKYYRQRLVCKNYDAKNGEWSKQVYFAHENGFQPPWYVATRPNEDKAEAIVESLTNYDWLEEKIPERLRIKHGKDTDLLFEGGAAWMEDSFGARYPPAV